MYMRVFLVVDLIRVQTQAHITLRPRWEDSPVAPTVTDLADMQHEEREVEEPSIGCQ